MFSALGTPEDGVGQVCWAGVMGRTGSQLSHQGSSDPMGNSPKTGPTTFPVPCTELREVDVEGLNLFCGFTGSVARESRVLKGT